MTTILSQRKAQRGPGNETLKKRKEQTAFYDRFQPSAGPGNLCPENEVDGIAILDVPSLEMTHPQLGNESSCLCIFDPAKSVRVDFKQTQSCHTVNQCHSHL